MEGPGNNGTVDSGREYFRIEVEIPLRITPIDEAEARHLATEVVAHVDPPLPLADPALVAWLDRVERKLDRLLSHQGLLERPRIDLEHRQSVDLSGAGLNYSSVDPIASGTAVLVEFELPESPILLVRCLGRVLEVRQPAELGRTPQIEVLFETIRQSDRDAVVRYTLAVQRQTIRSGSKRLEPRR